MATKTKEPTPTPWQMHHEEYCPEEIWGNVDGTIDGPKGTHICTVEGDDPYPNARHIVRCVNSHEKLVAACKSADAILYGVTLNCEDLECLAAIDSVRDQLTTAIKAAKGE